MAEYLAPDSERAGHIISVLSKMQFLSISEKAMLLKHAPYKGLVRRLLSLAFKGNIFRVDLDLLCKKTTMVLSGADERLATFVQLHEDFFGDELTGPELLKRLGKLMKKLHIREYRFYKDLLDGGTCYLDSLTYRKVLAKKMEDDYVRFMRPCQAAPDQAWGGRRYIIQPNYQGLQLKLILRKGKKPRLISGDQTNYANRMKGTLGVVQDWFDETGKSKMEFDGILIPNDKEDRPKFDWKAKDCCLYIYDYVDSSLPLKKRLKKVTALCNYTKAEGAKRVQAMPTEIVTGPVVLAEAKAFSRPGNKYCIRSGIIVKRWDSGYVHKRSDDWLCLNLAKETQEGTYTGRATIIGVSSERTIIYGVDNNGMEIEISAPEIATKDIHRYLGYTVEFKLLLGYYSFKRILYCKGREV